MLIHMGKPVIAVLVTFLSRAFQQEKLSPISFIFAIANNVRIREKCYLFLMGVKSFTKGVYIILKLEDRFLPHFTIYT